MTAVSAVAKIAVLRSVVADLRAETTEIVSVLSGLRPSRWDASTPADGWTIRDQVTHLAFFDDATLLALADPASFEMQREQLLAFGDGFPDEVADRYRALPAQTCLDWLIRSRDRLLAGYLGTDPSRRIPWYGPDMGLASSATGRLMETWAHGQDIVDTVGLVRPATHRLRGIAELPFDEESALYGLRLPPLHRDPFDRMLIAQAVASGVAIATPDPLIAQYPVRIIW